MAAVKKKTTKSAVRTTKGAKRKVSGTAGKGITCYPGTRRTRKVRKTAR